MTAILGTLAGKLGLAALVLLLLGGVVTYHEIAKSRAYDRGHAAGVAETTAQMKAAIAKQRAATVKDIAKLKTMDRKQLDDELIKRCREAGGGDACAQP